MKRSTSIFIALIMAAATFGTLRATMGPRHHGHWKHRYNKCEQQEKQNEKSESNDSNNQLEKK